MNSGSALLRKYEDNLNVCGMGVIILGTWDVLKVIMQLILDWKEFLSQLDLEMPDEENAEDLLVIIVAVAVVIVLTLLLFLIHFYIGRNAIKNSRREPYKKGYFVWTVILLALSLLGTLSYVDEIKEAEVIETTIASIIVDVTAIYIMATLVISTHKVKQLRAEGQS